jgi:hypothetical protein
MPMIEPATMLTTEQKQSALDQVLHSQTFARSDLLRSFLKYICELEIAGRGGELSEYVVGVEALGRKSGYSPSEDSSVRNRAHALRQKLQEFYSQEQPGSEVRIELPKGSYCPQFIASEIEPAAPVPADIVLPDLQAVPEQPQRKISAMVLPFLAGVLLTSVMGVLLWRFLPTPSKQANVATSLPAALREVWGPLFNQDANVLVCVATPMHMLVRQYENAPPPDLWTPATSPRLLELFQQRYKLRPQGQLFLLPSGNAAHWGDSVGAVTVTRTLATAGATFQIMPERLVSFPAMRDRHVILLGAPEYSPAAAQILQNTPFTLDYLPSIVDYVVLNRQPRQGEQSYYPWQQANQGNSLEIVYALVTVMPSTGAGDGPHRTVILSGMTSAGREAAAEYFTSPNHLQDFQQRLKADGLTTMPRAYQIVIKAYVDKQIPIRFHYETHRVLAN